MFQVGIIWHLVNLIHLVDVFFFIGLINLIDNFSEASFTCSKNQLWICFRCSVASCSQEHLSLHHRDSTKCFPYRFLLSYSHIPYFGVVYSLLIFTWHSGFAKQKERETTWSLRVTLLLERYYPSSPSWLHCQTQRIVFLDCICLSTDQRHSTQTLFFGGCPKLMILRCTQSCICAVG